MMLKTTMMLKTRAVFLGVAVLAAGPLLAGQDAATHPGATTNTMDAIEVAPLGPGESYGTSSLSAVTMSVFDCDNFAQGDTWTAVGGTPNRFLTAGFFECQIHAPAGSLITAIEIEGCDTNAAGEINANFIRTTTPGGGGGAIIALGTGLAAIPGCARFPLTLPTPELVDNQNRKYFFQITTANTAATQLAAVRAYYRLQVSPAPATATFTDVPTTSGQFRFVEALVAAGITGGCGTGVYCPNDPVTRGQMAVFLSVALGLHFPN